MELAIARDPCYGPALAWAAFCSHRLLLDGRSEDPEADRLKGTDFARRALEVAGDDPAMIALVDRALALNPNYARGWHISGNLRRWAGQPDIAIEHVEVSLRLSPRARIGASLFVIGAAYFDARRFDEAVPKLLLAIQDDPSSPAPHRYLAACNAHMGRLDDARESVKRLRAITSVVIPDASYLRNPEHRELFLSGLRLAASEATSARAAVSQRCALIQAGQRVSAPRRRLNRGFRRLLPAGSAIHRCKGAPAGDHGPQRHGIWGNVGCFCPGEHSRMGHVAHGVARGAHARVHGSEPSMGRSEIRDEEQQDPATSLEPIVASLRASSTSP
jgi:hypothetical protein